MQSLNYRLAEFFTLFIVFPLSLVLDYCIAIKIILGVIGFVYIVIVLLKIEKLHFGIRSNLNWSKFLKETAVKFLIITTLTIPYVFLVDRENLFAVVINKPLLWLGILFVYTLFSVYPQELIYRTFFFKRYQVLFKSEAILIFINAIVFSLAHIFFRNTLVLLLTFIGGILFAITYKTSKSTFLVSIEHAIYGCWLFTVGMGDMLGFPA
ncbi:CPBP family intramembrane glutamic endopeptidase [Hanstruepera ponticola]|uniref:CPBP family intramembrane glutamic endopeptidase n=1 Tax=Hanstruepera ponticola TaxID=2042995 RepID=UPI0017835BEB|nr:CPBP family intramembrane glutamic endopeptidase [Hanstruepera ponticola]